MVIPFSYIVRNLFTRRLTALLTVGGMALVVFVFTTVLMMVEGLRQTLVDTGSPDNVVITRRGAGNEVSSVLAREQAAIIESSTEIALGRDGRKLVSKEPIVLINLPKRRNNSPSNVVIRGVTEAGLDLRAQAKISEGRMFHPGTSEIIAGKGISAQFKGASVGETLHFAQRDWNVVGVLDAGGTGFDSEIWGDEEQLMQAFRRQAFSAMLVRLANRDRYESFKQGLDADPRLTVDAKRESDFYAEQSEGLGTFLKYFGVTISVILSIGATIGAMITMYAAVATRTAEIGTLRALGFPRRSVLVAFLAESMLLGAAGGIIGLVAASFMRYVRISTVNFQTFAELAFSFRLTLQILLEGMVFAVLMGVVGGFLPAARAAKLKIIDALRAA